MYQAKSLPELKYRTNIHLLQEVCSFSLKTKNDPLKKAHLILVPFALRYSIAAMKSKTNGSYDGENRGGRETMKRGS